MPIQLVAFPTDLRHTLAALDLAHETGQVDAATYERSRAAMIEDARVTLGVDPTWRTDATPPQDHQPGGFTSVWWHEV